MGYRAIDVEIKVDRQIVVSAERSIAVMGANGKKVFIPRWALPDPNAHAGQMVKTIKMGLKKAKKFGILGNL
jgi:hypothetical protein